ncbi:hypothetical protein Glove_291g13 [Diversispora epigaea]|uniref:Uncharacterized protein n=1 Tax=Diversispora epigaea TaxID=1348612 RepID=A0A397I091_9GLOM|nr:hypothetical protein Glove_291g13 [Diversispora epigaea]
MSFNKIETNSSDGRFHCLLICLRKVKAPSVFEIKEKLKHLLRNVLDPKSASTKVPNWACNEQEDVVYDTEFVQTEGEDEPSFASTSSSKISAEQ